MNKLEFYKINNFFVKMFFFSSADKAEHYYEPSQQGPSSELQIPTSSVFQQQVQQAQLNGQQQNGLPPVGGQNPTPFGGQQQPSFGSQNQQSFGGQPPPSFGNQQPPQFNSQPQSSFGSQQPPPFNSQPFSNQQPLQKPPQYAGQQQSSGLPQLMPSAPRQNDFPEGSNSPMANLPNTYGPKEFSD